MNTIGCVQREQLMSKYETALRAYMARVDVKWLDPTHTAPLRLALDLIEEAITEHCIGHGCNPSWVKSRRAK